MDTGSPLLGFSLSNNRSTKSLAPILFSMGYGCFLPYLRAGNRKESHLPGDELRRGRIMSRHRSGSNQSVIYHHSSHGPCAFRAFHPPDRAFACELKRWNEGCRQDSLSQNCLKINFPEMSAGEEPASALYCVSGARQKVILIDDGIATGNDRASGGWLIFLVSVG
jgi:hypothetical protein